MIKKALLLTLFGLIQFMVSAQDVLYFTNKDTMVCQVVKVGRKTIDYYLLNDKKEPLGGQKAAFITEMLYIKFKDGTITRFDVKTGQPISKYALDNDSISIFQNNGSLKNDTLPLELRAYLDAQENYTGYSSSSAGTFFLTLFTGGTIALPVVITQASTMPSFDHLGITNINLINSKGYTYYYKQEAYRIKKRHIWFNYGIALTIDFL